MPIKTIVLEEEAPNTSENSATQQSERGQESALKQAEEYGALKAKYEEAIQKIESLELRLGVMEGNSAEIIALRSELAQLRSEVIEMEEVIEEENSNVTLITPEVEPEPAQPELAPEIPPEPWLKMMLRI